MDGETVDARLARAYFLIEKGNLEMAIKEVEQIQGEPAKAIEPWLSEAKTRLRTDQLLRVLTARLNELQSH